MDGCIKDWLHTAPLGDHFLLSGFRIDSLSSFGLASLITICFCLFERLLTLGLSKHWTPFPFILQSRLRIALWRTFLYWLVTLDRLIYMLVAMSFHLGIIVVIVTALSAGQFIIEYIDTAPPQTDPSFNRSYEPHRSSKLPHIKEAHASYPLQKEDDEVANFSYTEPFSVWQSPVLTDQGSPSASTTRPKTVVTPRSRPKPEDIFIHPAKSHVMRAEALAVRYGFDSDLVDASSYTTKVPMENQFSAGDRHRLVRELLVGRGPEDKCASEQSQENENCQPCLSLPE